MEKRAVSIGDFYGSPVQKVEPQRLSPRRAFVVQFREAAGTESDTFAGRVEHVVSGRAAHFNSARQLTGFMRQVLKAAVDS